ncbi:MarR family transcriptional regulator [candidate division KSB1 bacterium]|jgi:DNA-binding MarR family transcriptional regulator|nr:MarR family transcriptional regulator [candidate division KSB1 bacterium]
MKLENEIKQKSFKNELERLWVNIIFTSHWIHEKHEPIFKEYGLTRQQYNILRILRGQYPNPATIQLLIERMMDKSSNASRIVDRLFQKKLVTRKICDKDRRRVDILITQIGLQILSEIDSKMLNLYNEFKALNKQQVTQLNQLLDKMRD